jgi:CBS domain-containing protein
MPELHWADAPPFDTLSAAQRARLREASQDLGFAPGDLLLAPNQEPEQVWWLHSGHVQHAEGDAVVGVYGQGALLALRALFSGRGSGSWRAVDAVRAQGLPVALLRELVAANPQFAAQVFRELADRMERMNSRDTQREFISLLMVKVRDAYIRKPFFVDGSTDLVTLCRQLAAEGLTNALVRDRLPAGAAGAAAAPGAVEAGAGAGAGAGAAETAVLAELAGTPPVRERIGMFTTTDLRDALLREEPPSRIAVREVARFDLITIEPDAEIFDALLLMVRHRVHRLLVREPAQAPAWPGAGAAPAAPRESDGGGRIVGVLSQLDLMSFVSNHSYIVALQIEQATSVADLQAAAARMDGLVALLAGGGVRVEVITALVSALNTRLFERTWALVAPPEVVANSCLIVMGSEGRGEQILKTDQDNALLLRDGFQYALLDAVARRFAEALASYGYPPCPGGIMVTSPLWRQPLSTFRESLRDWVYGADAEGAMRLAIFFDAVAVAGDASLLASARGHLDRILADHDAFLARFARAADQFAEPSAGLWARLTTRRDEQPLDLKKLGTFPIVHGVRALALKHHVRALGTAARIQALVEAGVLAEPMARDLVDALHFLMMLKLRHQLRQRQLGQTPGNIVRAADLGTLERDPLRDSLAIIRRFRAFLAAHFHFEAL